MSNFKMINKTISIGEKTQFNACPSLTLPMNGFEALKIILINDFR